MLLISLLLPQGTVTISELPFLTVPFANLFIVMNHAVISRADFTAIHKTSLLRFFQGSPATRFPGFLRSEDTGFPFSRTDIHRLPVRCSGRYKTGYGIFSVLPRSPQGLLLGQLFL